MKYLVSIYSLFTNDDGAVVRELAILVVAGCGGTPSSGHAFPLVVSLTVVNKWVVASCEITNLSVITLYAWNISSSFNRIVYQGPSIITFEQLKY